MIHVLRASDLWLKPTLAASMFADRRKQFRDRLGWAVNIDHFGYERDVYDAENPYYVIVEAGDGSHGGSMRLLPTIGRTMIFDHFQETLAGREIRDPGVWECTRFCLAPAQDREVALQLLATGAMLIRKASLKKLVAIFDPCMIRVYRRNYIEPEIIGWHNYSSGKAVAGYWSFDQEKFDMLLSESGLDVIELERALANAGLPCVRDEIRLAS